MIDMAWGSPTFLSEYWKKNPIKIDHIEKTNDYQMGSRDLLKENIKKLHLKIGNARVVDRHIVVASGGTQILLALLSVLKNKLNVKYAWAEPPHFSRFPILTEISKLNWKNDKSSIRIVSIPNNPDNQIKTLNNINKSKLIVDLCYNWPQYINDSDKIEYDLPIMVFSLSKATGHASTRIGWAIVKDENLAKELEYHIEVSTGGLSIDSQVKAEQIISHQLNVSYEDSVFNYGKKELKKRWKQIKKANPKFKILNNNGMFLWAKGKCPKEIKHLNGVLLGSNDKHFRLNIGCSKKTFKLFIDIINKKCLN